MYGMARLGGIFMNTVVIQRSIPKYVLFRLKMYNLF